VPSTATATDPTTTTIDPTLGALRAYTDELEAELWSLHQARVLSLTARVAHDRLRREHGQVAAQALSDPLTGLPNRRALDTVLRRLVGAGAPEAAVAPSVAMVDVDHFKRVNDALSHARGDEVLRLVAGALRGSLRTDDVVARYGGDEFVVVLPATRPHDAGVALARAVRTVADLAGEAEGVTLSIGVVAARPPEDPRSVLARADRVMYGVKRDGGDGVRLVEGPGAPVVSVDPSQVPDAPVTEVLGNRAGHPLSGPFVGALTGATGDLPGFRVPRATPDPTSPAGESDRRK
jgi:diguanylate cyclase (GGDEF)-like protein